MGSRDKEDKKRPDWREIDRKRDRPGHGPRAKGDEKHFLKDAKKDLYLKQVDKFFGAKKLSKDEREGIKKIEKAYGTPKFDAAVKKYVDEFGIPEDWNGLMMMLEYSDTEVVVDGVLPMFLKMYPERTDAEKTMLRYKMETLAMTSDDPLLEASLERLLEKLEA